MAPQRIPEFVPLRSYPVKAQGMPRVRSAAEQLSVYSTPVGAISDDDGTSSDKWSALHDFLAAILPPPRPQTGAAAAVADAQARAARAALHAARKREQSQEDNSDELEVEQLVPLRRSSIDEVEHLCGVVEPSDPPRTPVKLRPRPRPRASPYLLSRVVPVSPERRK